MLRWMLTLGTALALATAAQAAPVRLAEKNARVQALAVADGRALAIVDSLDRARPFELVTGGGSPIGKFGVREAEFPDLAVDSGGHVVAVWARPVSGGSSLEAVTVRLSASDPFGAPQVLAQATGPPRLVLTGGRPLLAFPDRDGDLALLENAVPAAERGAARPQAYALTASGPQRRHLALELVIGPDGPLALDLVQTRRLTELRVVGAGAPAPPVTSVRGLRNIPAAMAADEERIVAVYVSGGRVVLATARANGGWSRRRLPGPGGGSDAPAVMLVDGGAIVAYEQRVPRIGRRPLEQLFLATVHGNRVRSRRLTYSHADDGRPLAAADSGGDAFVAWTRVALGSGFRTPYITRVR